MAEKAIKIDDQIDVFWTEDHDWHLASVVNVSPLTVRYKDFNPHKTYRVAKGRKWRRHVVPVSSSLMRL